MTTAFVGARLFDGADWHDGSALLVEAGRVSAIVAAGDIPAGAETVRLEGGTLAPGFVDLQVNGGGGVLFNNAPAPQSIETICAAHLPFGTTSVMVTLITDTAAVNEQAIAAGRAAAAADVPGFAGLHLEGPHLAVSRKGTHDPALIRTMDESDERRIAAAADTLPALIVTVAAETVPPDQIARLARAGAIVSLGHSDASYAQARAAFAAGATMVTHLFNAMSQFSNREPGLVGAALDSDVASGLIADGIHVHPRSIALALAAKQGRGEVFLVTDAMSQTGTDLKTLTLNGRTITRANGALRLADGTLAGADLNMIDAVRFMHKTIGLDLGTCLAMASAIPARAARLADRGHFAPGTRADLVHLSQDLEVQACWIAGERRYTA